MALNSKDLRRIAWAAKVDDMREGRKLKASTFATKRGKGSYRRKGKYGNKWE